MPGSCHFVSEPFPGLRTLTNARGIHGDVQGIRGAALPETTLRQPDGKTLEHAGSSATLRRMDNPLPPWSRLRDADLLRWAGPGAVKHGQRLFAKGRVHDIVRSDVGEALATVTGSSPSTSHAHIAAVALEPGKRLSLDSQCTCKRRVRCAHAVAVALAFRAEMLAGHTPKKATRDDRRPGELASVDAAEVWELIAESMARGEQMVGQLEANLAADCGSRMDWREDDLPQDSQGGSKGARGPRTRSPSPGRGSRKPR